MMKKGLHVFIYAIAFALLDIFPISWYGKDLRECMGSLWHSIRSSISTILNIITITLLIITITVVAGLYAGSTQWMKEYITNNRMAKAIQISTIGTNVKVLNDQTIEEVKHITIQGNKHPIEGAFGWTDVSMWFYTATDEMDFDLTYGRTIDIADPVLNRIKLLYKKTADEQIFQNEGIGQIFVSQSLLKSLGYKINFAANNIDIPHRVKIQYLDSFAELEIIGIAELNSGDEFFITEEFNRMINDKQWNPNPRYDRVYWGPIDKKHDPVEWLKTIQPYLQGSRVQVQAEIVKRTGLEEWVSFQKPREEAWTKEKWEKMFLQTVKEKIGNGAENMRHEFSDPLPPEVKPFEKIDVGYMKATIYVSTLSDVPMVVDKLTDMEYKVINNVKQLALIFMQIDSFGKKILIAVIIIVGILTSITIFLSFTQTIQRKTPEIGILKAFGTDNLWVFLIYMSEAFIIWGISIIIGNCLVYPVAHFVNNQLVNIFTLQGFVSGVEETIEIVNISYRLLVIVGIGSLGLCWLSTFLASLIAVTLQPAKAINIQR